MSKSRNTKYEKIIGYNITKARKSKGLSLKSLGEVCNLNEKEIASIEKGLGSLHIDTLIKIADALQMDLKTFF